MRMVRDYFNPWDRRRTGSLIHPFSGLPVPSSPGTLVSGRGCHMERFSRFVLAHRRAIGTLWLVLLLTGGYASSILTSHLDQSFQIPGTPSAKATAAVVQQYRSGGTTDPLVPV